MEKSFLKINNINAYNISSSLSDDVWDIVDKWDTFSKNTLGSQIVRAIDSIAANIAEGFGRYHKKDKQKFFYNARGSLYEALHWTEKAQKRKLLTNSKYSNINEKLINLPKEINWLIKITEEKLTI